MQRGKRKSPFVGATEVIGSTAAPILYQRYTNLSDILMDGSVPPLSSVGAAPPKRKPKREKVKKPKVDTEDNPAHQAKQQKQPKKPKGPRKLAPEERVSGPGNATEALKIREALGYVAATQQEVAQAEAAAQRAARPTFAFGFGIGSSASPATHTPVAGGGSVKALAKKQDTSSSSSDEGSRGESEDEGEEPSSSADSESASASEEEVGANGVQGNSSSSSESEDDSSESEDDDAAAKAKQPDSTQLQTSQQAQQQRQRAAAPVPQAQQAEAAPPADTEDGEFVPRRVYVGGMPFSYNEDKVHEYWSYCGEIESMDCMTFPDTGRFRGIVFITFTTQEGYNAALACDGEQCDGQTLKVQRCKWSPKERAARDRQRAAQQAPPNASPGSAPHLQQPPAAPPAAGRQQFQSPAPKTEGYNVAYVGNIAFEADDKELQQLFEGYNVTKVRLHTDKDTGRSKGFAHVHFRDSESLDRALALNGTQLHGRKIKMGYAQPKKE